MTDSSWCLPPCLHPRITHLEDGVATLNDVDNHLLTLDGRREFHNKSTFQSMETAPPLRP